MHVIQQSLKADSFIFSIHWMKINDCSVSIKVKCTLYRNEYKRIKADVTYLKFPYRLFKLKAELLYEYY